MEKPERWARALGIVERPTGRLCSQLALRGAGAVRVGGGGGGTFCLDCGELMHKSGSEGDFLRKMLSLKEEPLRQLQSASGVGTAKRNATHNPDRAGGGDWAKPLLPLIELLRQCACHPSQYTSLEKSGSSCLKRLSPK